MKNGIQVNFYTPRHPLLKGLIQHFWTLKSNTINEFNYDIIPGTNINIIINLSNSVEVKGENTEKYSDGLISGEKEKYYQFKLCDKLNLFGFLFYPGAAFSFLNVPIKEVSGLLDLNLLVKNFSEIVKEKLLTTNSTFERLQIIEQELLKWINFEKFPDSGINYAVKMLNKTNKNINIVDFCDSSGINRRKLERHFNTYVGLSPKRFQQVNRIQKALVKVISVDHKDLTQLCYECGYYDQSHFIREFKYFMGTPPGQFFNKKENLIDNKSNNKSDVDIYSASYTDPNSDKNSILMVH